MLGNASIPSSVPTQSRQLRLPGAVSTTAGCRTNIVAQAARDFFAVQTGRIQRSWPHKIAEIQWSTNHKRKCAVKRVLLATPVVCLLTAQTANATGCLKGTVLGGVAGHMAHHTFLGIFGGCVGGLYVHTFVHQMEKDASRWF
jgi:hypothetical protein